MTPVRLSRQEALVVRELARTPRRAVDVNILLDAGEMWGGTQRDEKKRLAALVRRVRVKYGHSCIRAVHADRRFLGYALYPESVVPCPPMWMARMQQRAMEMVRDGGRE